MLGIVAVPPLEEEVDERSRDDGGLVVVYGAKGGNMCGFCEDDNAGGGVFGGCGRCRSMNLVDVGVRKQEIWDDAK